MAILAIDYGGTRIKFGLIEKGGKIIAVDHVAADPDGTIRENLASIHHKALISFDKHLHNLSGIGIALPSIIDSEKNQVVSRYVKYTSAVEFDFNDWAKKTWDLPLAMENDARAALIGEWQYGAGKDCDDIVLLTLGTGVGSAVLSGGKLFKGKHLLAGSLSGHSSINFQGEPCNCGFYGCLEKEASTWSLPQMIKSHPGFVTSSLAKIERPEYIHLFEEADKDDPLAKTLLEKSLKAWATGVVNLVHAYDPDLIIIGGGIMRQQEKILPYIRKTVDQYAWLPPGTTRIAAAQQTDYAGLLGMEYLTNTLINKTRP